MIFLGLALWWDLRRDLRLFRKYTASNFEKVFETNFEKVFETLDPLVNETKRTSAASPRQRLSNLLLDQDQGRTNCFSESCG